ncbi:MAG: protein kinase [Acidobacteria bacterium]|nr:protein kinase [Acidobacteriota bacterium]
MAIPLSYIEGKYEILEKLQEGGMGAIYKVRHRLLDEVRVIKVMQPQHEKDDALRQRFLREARMAVKLRHPNIAQMYDFAIDDAGNAFIVMEFINGITCQDLLERVGPPEIGLTLEVARQALAALGYLHRKGIVHRDISPDNVMVMRDDDGRPLVKLIDLGIAKVLAGDSGLTQTGMFLGKLRYSSPEQFRSDGETPVEQRSDIYSFGIVLYEMLTGKHPISGSTPPALIAGHLLNPPVEFSVSDPEGRVPDDLRAVVARSLGKRPEDRFPTVQEFAQALAEVLRRFPSECRELDRALDLPVGPTQKIQVHRGTTQDRIDRHFKMGTTPSPTAGSVTGGELPPTRVLGRETLPPPPPPPPPAPAAGTAQVRALLLGAEKLVKSGHLEEARMQLGAVLQIDAANEAARRLLAEVDAGIAAANEAGRKARELEEVLAAIDGSLQHGDLEEARERLRSAEAAHGLVAGLDAVRERVGQLAATRLRERVEALLAEGEALAGRGALPEATACLEQAIELAPNEVRVRAAMSRVRDVQRRAGEARAREESLRSALAAIDEALAGGDAPTAVARFEEAFRAVGDCAELQAARDRIGELQRRQRAERVAVLLVDGQRLQGEGRFGEAVEACRAALSLAPGDRAVHDALAHAQELQRRDDEARQRATNIRFAVVKVEELIAAGDLDAAAELLEAATATLGESDELAEKREGLEVLREQERLAQIEALVAQAREHLEAGRLEEGVAVLRRAVAAAPEDTTAGSLLAEAEERLREIARARERERAAAAAVAEIEELIGAGKLDSAIQRLGAAAAKLGGDPRWGGLGERIEEALQREREARFASHLDAAERLLGADKFDEALARLDQAAEIDPQAPRLAELRAAVDEGRHRPSKETLKSQKASHAAARIEACLERGELQEAERELALAERLFGRTSLLRTLRTLLDEAARRERQDRVEALVLNATRLAAAGVLDRAVASFREACELDPGNGRLQGLLDGARRREAALSVESLLARGDLAGAEAALELAERLHGSEGDLAAVRARLDDLKRG